MKEYIKGRNAMMFTHYVMMYGECGIIWTVRKWYNPMRWFGEMSDHCDPCLREVMEQAGIPADKLDTGD